MFSRPAIIKLSVVAALVFASLGLSPRSAAQGLQQQLESTYALTKPTDDKSDIVTAGAVLILQKDKIIMYSTANQVLPQNTYKAGKLSEGAFGVHDNVQKFGSFIGHPPPQQAHAVAALRYRRKILGHRYCRAVRRRRLHPVQRPL